MPNLESKFDIVAERALDELLGFFSNKTKTGELIGRARVATSLLNSYTRMRQTESSMQALDFARQRDALTAPRAPRALPAGGKR